MASWKDLFIQEPWEQRNKRDKSAIKRINMAATDMNKCKVICDGYNVYANAVFYPGDIIEVCPTRVIDNSALYSKDMRSIVFEVVPNTVYVIPFGYCQYYSIISKDNPVANCDYIWDDGKKVILIQAISKINKYEQLVLNINQ